ncbi:S41 family peptidase [Chondromyces apiculatus]|uniref:Tail specific protease domain-containing protein n=1 Tax=Chondromyces apiculatus DSM 436 TaxID=1192034 RepID=A0A017TB35_9BACT|nr:S41 family peptidase [Chondromyces apiculatus]EYF06102.1 Hypothetical protein CAP_2292 [Chondromyces apiculatus DSM 436]
MADQVLDRRLFCGATLASMSAPLLGIERAEPARDISLEQDFDELWETLAARYCFFGEKATDWDAVRAFHRPLALAATSLDAFAAALGRMLHELYDAHTHLNDAPEGTPRFPPFDLLVERARDVTRVVAVEESSAAAAAGLRPGDEILAADGMPMDEAAASLLPRCLSRRDRAADAYAWNAAVAGRRGRPRLLLVRSGGACSPRAVPLPLSRRAPEPDLSFARRGDVGTIRISTFGEEGTVARFDAALSALKDTRGLVIDVRRNGGGDTAIARPIMGRFIDARRPYARMRRRQGAGLGPFWTEHVEAPVVVLCDAWSASMAEGFPMGMRGLGRARIVGTPMMGLGAAVFAIRLDRTGIQAQYSAEPVHDVADRPRWLLRPDVEVAPGQDIMAAGLAELHRLIDLAALAAPRRP